ncbi:hypothetical protein L1987_49013 [Smallanthus sonchifolius]|uniref:Uncharacterized protein n=1 Tax=Smallanthus sonchifolius TaxID=185202 RepID=A0ACB9FTJ8_9ASTR|nr:hypothetical protein L1987_49013 [Smallanthus sonchifolius]
MKRIARPMYSNPHVHGARIVANVVGKEQMEMMVRGFKSVRQKLYHNLFAKDKSGKDWSFILKQIGMFSFTDGKMGGYGKGSKHVIYSIVH